MTRESINRDGLNLRSISRRGFLKLAGAAGLLAGCSVASRSTPAPEAVTISLAYDEIMTSRTSDLIQQFKEQYPHITVDLCPMSHYELAWDPRANYSDVREVFVAHFGTRIRLYELDRIIALDSFISQDRSLNRADFLPFTLEAFAVEGKTWAVPFGSSSSVMYYNKDLFDQHDVAYPRVGWTWDDFVDTGLAIRDPTKGIYGHASLGGGWDKMVLLYQHGGKLLDDLCNPTCHTFDDPLIVELLEWWGSLYHQHDMGYTPPFSPKRDSEKWWKALEEIVVTQKTGMWSDSIAYQGGANVAYEAPWPMRWGLVTLPRSTAQSATDIAGYVWTKGYAITANSQHPDEAWKLVSFLSKQTHVHHIPVRRSILESKEYERWSGSDAVAVARAIAESGVPFYPESYELFHIAYDILGDAASMVQSGERTAQEAIEWAQRAADVKLEL